MNTRLAWSVIGALAVVIVVLAVLLFATPVPSEDGTTPLPAPTPAPEPFTSENVKVNSPLPDAAVARTFNVSGEARGTWFFEASFPIFVVSANNEKIGQGIAQAQSDWMTTDWVPFTATVTTAGYSGPATLVLLKDNPSGLPENDDAVEFPVVIQ